MYISTDLEFRISLCCRAPFIFCVLFLKREDCRLLQGAREPHLLFCLTTKAKANVIFLLFEIPKLHTTKKTTALWPEINSTKWNVGRERGGGDTNLVFEGNGWLIFKQKKNVLRFPFVGGLVTTRYDVIKVVEKPWLFGRNNCTVTYVSMAHNKYRNIL